MAILMSTITLETTGTHRGERTLTPAFIVTVESKGILGGFIARAVKHRGPNAMPLALAHGDGATEDEARENLGSVLAGAGWIGIEGLERVVTRGRTEAR